MESKNTKYQSYAVWITIFQKHMDTAFSWQLNMKVTYEIL